MAGPWNNSTTAASNTTVGGTGIAGSNAVSNFDNGLREVIAQMKRGFEDLGGAGTAGGTADAITLALSSGSPTSYQDGMFFTFVAGGTNTGAATLNINSVGAEPIKKMVGGTETALAAGDIVASNHYGVIWRSDFDSAAGGWLLVDLNNNLSSVGQDILPGTDSTYDLGSSSKAFAQTHSDAFYTGGNKIANIIGIQFYEDGNQVSTTTTTSFAEAGPEVVNNYTPKSATSEIICMCSFFVVAQHGVPETGADIRAETRIEYFDGTSWTISAPNGIGRIGYLGSSNITTGGALSTHWGRMSFQFKMPQSLKRSDTGNWLAEIKFSAGYDDSTITIDEMTSIVIEYEPEA